jgi:hypothetical protein
MSEAIISCRYLLKNYLRSKPLLRERGPHQFLVFDLWLGLLNGDYLYCRQLLLKQLRDLLAFGQLLPIAAALPVLPFALGRSDVESRQWSVPKSRVFLLACKHGELSSTSLAFIGLASHLGGKLSQ